MKHTIIALALLTAFAANATPGGESNNTGCNGVGNANSPCAGSTPIPGPQGPAGPMGPRGANGADGKNGTHGASGRDGAQGAAGVNGRDGRDGRDGPADAVTLPQLAAAVQSIEKIGRNAYAGTAGAIAAASIPQAPEPGTKIIGAGAGYYRGESALSFGISLRSESGKWITKAFISADSRGAVGAGAGVAYVWR